MRAVCICCMYEKCWTSTQSAVEASSSRHLLLLLALFSVPLCSLPILSFKRAGRGGGNEGDIPAPANHCTL